MTSKNSSSSSKGLGNTITKPLGEKKQIAPAKRWCFTLNNFTDEDKALISSIVPTKCGNAIIGSEIGDSGTPHLQGYLEFNVKCRPLNVIPISGIHWEKAKGNIEANYRYCSKDAALILTTGNYRLPKPVKVLDDSALFKWQKEIVNIVTDEPDDRTIYWYWSKEGCVGKTTFCKYLTMRHGAICLHGKGADVRNGVCDFLKNQGRTPDIVLFPIPRSTNTDYLSYEALENIKDMYFYSGKYEGGMVCGNSPHLIVFANEEPEYTKCSQDRWKVVNIDDKPPTQQLMDCYIEDELDD